MLRRRESLPSWAGLCVRLAVTILGLAAIFFFTRLASAKQDSSNRKLSAPASTLAGADSFESARGRLTGVEGYRKLPWTNVNKQEKQNLDPVHITTSRAPEGGGQQALVMPLDVYVSHDYPWFGPFFTLNDPDRSVFIDILHRYGFVSTVPGFKTIDIDFCNLPGYADSG